MDANLYTLFAAHVADAAAPCLVVPNGPVVTYGELDALSARIAHALVRRRLQARRPGRRADRQALDGAAALPRDACARASSTCRSTPATSATELEYFFGDAEPRVDRLRQRAAGHRRRGGARRDGAHARRDRRRAPRPRRRPVRVDVRDRRARARRPRGDPLHVGHDRALEGRDADAPQPRVERARAGRARGGSRAATCCCTRCRSTTCTACSSRSTACCCREAACCGCRSSTHAR